MTNGESSFGNTPTLPPIAPMYVDRDGKWFSKEEMNLPNREWTMVALNNYKAVSMSRKMLPAGAYDITIDEKDGKPVFIKKDLIHDKIIPLTGLPKLVVDEIDDFWKKGDLFAKLGFLHRRGYLFYGSHGTGKSSLVHEISNKIIQKDGIVFYANNPEHFNEGLALFRQVEPDREVVCVFEDIDAIVRKYGENTILSILDGENQISKVCNLATTNYPELLDKRIVGRPRRFDRVYRIGNLEDKARKTFLKSKLPQGADVNKWVTRTQGLSIAAISDCIISVYCFDKTIDEAVKIVSTLTDDKSSDEYRTNSMGLSKEDEED